MNMKQPYFAWWHSGYSLTAVLLTLELQELCVFLKNQASSSSKGGFLFVGIVLCKFDLC